MKLPEVCSGSGVRRARKKERHMRQTTSLDTGMLWRMTDSWKRDELGWGVWEGRDHWGGWVKQHGLTGLVDGWMDGWLCLWPWKGLDGISCGVTFPKCQSEIRSTVKLAAWESSPGGPRPAHRFCLTWIPATLGTTEINYIERQVHQSHYTAHPLMTHPRTTLEQGSAQNTHVAISACVGLCQHSEPTDSMGQTYTVGKEEGWVGDVTHSWNECTVL